MAVSQAVDSGPSRPRRASNISVDPYDDSTLFRWGEMKIAAAPVQRLTGREPATVKRSRIGARRSVRRSGAATDRASDHRTAAARPPDRVPRVSSSSAEAPFDQARARQHHVDIGHCGRAAAMLTVGVELNDAERCGHERIALEREQPLPSPRTSSDLSVASAQETRSVIAKSSRRARASLPRTYFSAHVASTRNAVHRSTPPAPQRAADQQARLAATAMPRHRALTSLDKATVNPAGARRYKARRA